MKWLHSLFSIEINSEISWGKMSDKMKGMIKKVENADKDLAEDVNYVIIEPIESSVHTYAAFWITHLFGQPHQTWYHSQFSAKAKSITF